MMQTTSSSVLLPPIHHFKSSMALGWRDSKLSELLLEKIDDASTEHSPVLNQTNGSCWKITERCSITQSGSGSAMSSLFHTVRSSNIWGPLILELWRFRHSETVAFSTGKAAGHGNDSGLKAVAAQCLESSRTLTISMGLSSSSTLEPKVGAVTSSQGITVTLGAMSTLKRNLQFRNMFLDAGTTSTFSLTQLQKMGTKCKEEGRTLAKTLAALN